jgi:hypothetical protein
MSHSLRTIDGLLNLQGNAQLRGKTRSALRRGTTQETPVPLFMMQGKNGRRCQGIYHKDEDGAGDKRRLVLLAKQRSLPTLLATSLTFSRSIDELITKPVSEPILHLLQLYSSNNRKICVAVQLLYIGEFREYKNVSSRSSPCLRRFGVPKGELDMRCSLAFTCVHPVLAMALFCPSCVVFYRWCSSALLYK